MKLKSMGPLLLVAWAASSCGEVPSMPGAELAPAAVRTTRQEVRSTNKVLILGSSVNGGINSPEAQAVRDLWTLTGRPPVTIDVVTPAQWGDMTPQDFMSYYAIIIGDAGCTSGTAAFQAAVDNRDVWGPVIDGDVVIVGTNPTSGSKPQLMRNGIEHVIRNSQMYRTGLYVSLGCAYQSAPVGTVVTLLDELGEFKVQGSASNCAATAGHIFEMSPQYLNRAVNDAYLGMGGCAARSVFTTYPFKNFAVVTIGLDAPGAQEYIDYLENEPVETPYFGTPYILVLGAESRGSGCGGTPDWIPSGEECDLGDGFNGAPAPEEGYPPDATCSYSCRLNWCGDGNVDAIFGEQCDDGYFNGRADNGDGTLVNGMCTRSCQIVDFPVTSHPPEPRCTNVTVSAPANQCGAAADINNGSSDPDDDLVGCTQSPAGPYNVGTTQVSLTCTDAAGNSATTPTPCIVTVRDITPPTVSIGTNPTTVECAFSGAYNDLGDVTYSDLCSPPVTVLPRTGTVTLRTPGTYPLTYSGRDAANNTGSAIRSVIVRDTGVPNITLSLPSAPTVECGGTYTEPGWNTSDACMGTGTLNGSVVVGGTINPGVVGTYPLTYNVTDDWGNAAAQRTRIVIVRDILRPTVTINPPLAMTVECNDPAYQDPGATATDQCAGTLTAIPITPPNVGAPGTYPVSYRATDPSGNVGTSSNNRTVTVSDTLAPTVTLNGAAAMGLECAMPWSDPGATANDQCAGNLAVTVSNTVDNRQLGPQTITYSATDPQGFSDSKPRTVTVSDTVPPTVTPNGSLNQPVECNDPTYADPGATVSEACDPVPPPYVVVNPAPIGTPGTHTVHYEATDLAGNVGRSATGRTVTVNDTLNPAVALNGAAAMSLECASPWNDPGATASDQCSGSLPVTMTGSVDNRLLSAQTLTYSATDGAGRSDSKTRTVTVRDTQAPTVTLNGSPSQRVECNDPNYQDPGATASDACDVPPPAAVAVNPPPVGAPGSYNVIYQATDRSGNVGTSATGRSVTVEDTLPPTLALQGDNPQALECGTAWADPGATASDQCAGPLTVNRSGGVNHGVPADYTITYSATDGQTPTLSQTRTVNVRDTLPPDIVVNGPADEQFECGGTYVDPGASATDVCVGGPVPVTATRVGDPTRLGTFTITYSAEDPSGNEVTSPVVRMVTVNDDTPPTLMLVGSATPTVECGTSWTDPGATANDACFGDLTPGIVRNGSVNTDEPGIYRLTYNVMDGAGLSATPVLRTVNVSDTLAPSITVLGPLSQSVQCDRAPYSDPGATAADSCDGNRTAVIQTMGSVNTGIAGSYTLSYWVADLSDNQTTAAEVRTVIVVDDQAPTISLTGPADGTHECGSPYNDPGATANDACAGDLTPSIVRTGSMDGSAPGVYTLNYTVTDPSNLMASTQRRVTVSDTLAPVLTLVGPATQNVECGPGYEDPGATVTDACARNLDTHIQVTGAANSMMVGDYDVTFAVSDNAGNPATPLTRHVKVVDTQPPHIVCPEPIRVAALEGTSATVKLGTASAEDECSEARVVNASQTIFPIGATEVTYTATDAAGNTATCTSTVTVLEPVERALLGSGNGCSSTGSGPSSLAVMGLGVLAALLARKRTQPVLLALGVLLLGARASAQPAGVPPFELELLKLNPSATGSLLLGTGELLPDGEHRLSLTTHYENDPLVLFLNGEKIGGVVQHRATAHLAAAYGLWGWVELGAQVPMLLLQRGEDLTAHHIDRPKGGLTPGTPLFTLRVKLLAEREEDPVDLSLGVHAGPPVGSEAALARELRATPSVMAGRRFSLLRAAIDAGILLRPRTVLSPGANIQDELGHALRLGGMLSTFGEGLRGELALITLLPLTREGSSIETLAGARWSMSDSVEVYGLAGLAFGNAPGTPDFRVLLGVAHGRARPPRVESIQQEPVPDPPERSDPPAPDGEAVPEKDSDGDDILEENDACPAEAGIAEMRGCPARDTDQDTVQDHLDNCPEVEGPVENQGCPAEEKQLVAIQKDRIEIKDTVHFDFDKATIQSRSFPLLDQVARILTEHPEILSVTIEGHTDERGSAEYNRDLSQRRAEAVRDYLAQKGVARERMQAQGFGEDRPVQSNATDEGRAANRRVEFITRYTQAAP